MKKLFSILVFSCICMVIHAQIPVHSYLKIELNQTGLPYTTNTTRNDYYPEFNIKQDDYKFVHEADSSYMVGEIPIAFKLNHELPSFLGMHPSEFCNWIGNKIFDLLENGKKYSFWFTVDFTLSDNGYVTDVRVNSSQSDKKLTPLDDSILAIIRESPRWAPERFYWKRYYTPLSLRISSDRFVKGKGMVIIEPYGHYYSNSLSDQLCSDSPDKAQRDVIPDYQIATDKDIDEKAHLEDESVNLNQWIKSNIQDVTEMVGFGDGESEVELIISDNGWVAKATVINSYDQLLGKYLADKLMDSCPRWVPAKVNGISVPSKVRITYSWRF